MAISSNTNRSRTDRWRSWRIRDIVSQKKRDGLSVEKAVTRARKEYNPDGGFWYKVCLECKKKYTPKRSDSKYCGQGCKQAAYRKRNNER